MDRRRMLAMGVAASTMTLSGCFTSRLHEHKPYQELISGVLISNDKKTIAVIGKKHHYLFAAPGQMLAALDPLLNPQVKEVKFSAFKVDKDNNVFGDVILVAVSLDSEQRDLALKSGFSASGRNDMTARVELRGRRYLAKQAEMPAVERLKKEYRVTVIEDPSLAGNALKIAATPIAVAADGAVVLGAVVLSPIWLPLVLSNVCFVCK